MRGFPGESGTNAALGYSPGGLRRLGPLDPPLPWSSSAETPPREGEFGMSRLSRRQVLGGAAAAAAALTLAVPSANAKKRRGTLRFVAQADLKVLDPVW